MPRLINIVGARPNFMKIAPLVREMGRHPDLEQMLVHTGQHYDDNLSRVFFEQLGIPRADVNLGVGSGSRDAQIQQIAEAFEPVLDDYAPDAVLVVGDVNSTIACAGVARRRGVKVVHVEAGLRSFDQSMPEERNRCETDAISDLLFVTEPSGLENLEREGNTGRRFLVGNVMIDSLVHSLEKARHSDILARMGVGAGSYFVATFHRPSNVDSRENLTRLVSTLAEIAARLGVVLPLHPRTRHSLDTHGLLGSLSSVEGLVLSEPLGYLEFLQLLSHARAAITDSGGIQEETTYLGVPCLTMRENTERPITVDIGSNVLVGSDRRKLFEAIDAVLANRFEKGRVPDLWDGRASNRIVEILRGAL